MRWNELEPWLLTTAVLCLICCGATWKLTSGSSISINGLRARFLVVAVLGVTSIELLILTHVLSVRGESGMFGHSASLFLTIVATLFGIGTEGSSNKTEPTSQEQRQNVVGDGQSWNYHDGVRERE